MAQLCLWIKIRTKHWLVLSAFQTCGFSMPQMRQFCLFTYPPRSKWASYAKMIFFFVKIGIFCKSIAGPLPSVVEAYTQPYLFGGRVKGPNTLSCLLSSPFGHWDSMAWILTSGIRLISWALFQTGNYLVNQTYWIEWKMPLLVSMLAIKYWAENRA